jgi:ribose transport system permease protein
MHRPESAPLPSEKRNAATASRTFLVRHAHDPATQKAVVNLLVLGGFIVFGAIKTDVFLTHQNIDNVLNHISLIVIIGSAMTLLMVSGGFDLSVGANVALTGVVAATLVLDGHSLAFGALIGTGVGLLIGVLNATLVIFFRINSFIATIGTYYMCRGIAQLVTNGTEVYPGPGFAAFGNAQVLGLQITTFCMFVFLAVFWIIQRRTVLGRYAVASGDNANAAYLSGVPVRLTRFVCFGLTGLAAGFGGVLITSQLGSGVPDASTGLEFQVIVAAVVGGASLFGAEGSVIGTFCGALIIGILNNLLNLLGVQSYWQTVMLGVVLIAAVGFDVVLRQPETMRRLRWLVSSDTRQIQSDRTEAPMK